MIEFNDGDSFNIEGESLPGGPAEIVLVTEKAILVMYGRDGQRKVHSGWKEKWIPVSVISKGEYPNDYKISPWFMERWKKSDQKNFGTPDLFYCNDCGPKRKDKIQRLSFTTGYSIECTRCQKIAYGSSPAGALEEWNKINSLTGVK